MKTLKTIYWVVTIVMCAFILLGAVVDVAAKTDTLAFFKHLGYPAYFARFIGSLKILGAVAVLVPRFPKLKEWAYAGLVFDTSGALYSHFSTGDGPQIWFGALLGLLLIVASYVLYSQRVKKEGYLQF